MAYQPDALIRQRWPTAQAIRPSGKCPVCKHDTEYSFVLPQYASVRGEQEACGYVCLRCGWSNAGSRAIEPQDTGAQG